MPFNLAFLRPRALNLAYLRSLSLFEDLTLPELDMSATCSTSATTWRAK